MPLFGTAQLCRTGREDIVCWAGDPAIQSAFGLLAVREVELTLVPSDHREDPSCEGTSVVERVVGLQSSQLLSRSNWQSGGKAHRSRSGLEEALRRWQTW